MSAELPEMADASAMTAQLENGLLTVTIKKKPEVQPKRIEILRSTKNTHPRRRPRQPLGRLFIRQL